MALVHIPQVAFELFFFLLFFLRRPQLFVYQIFVLIAEVFLALAYQVQLLLLLMCLIDWYDAHDSRCLKLIVFVVVFLLMMLSNHEELGILLIWMVESFASSLASDIIIIIDLLPFKLPIRLLLTGRVTLIVVIVFIIIVVLLVAVPVRLLFI